MLRILNLKKAFGGHEVLAPVVDRNRAEPLNRGEVAR